MGSSVCFVRSTERVGQLFLSQHAFQMENETNGRALCSEVEMFFRPPCVAS